LLLRLAGGLIEVGAIVLITSTDSSASGSRIEGSGDPDAWWSLLVLGGSITKGIAAVFSGV